MTVIQIIYGIDPYCLWLCMAGLALAIAAVSGSSLPMWTMTAAFVVAVASAATNGFGPLAETALFLALSLAFTVPAARRAWRAAERAKPEPRPEHPARLIGRVARSTGDFANGVGRVWIDGAEWAAEIEGGEDVPRGHAVRVTRVIGGVKLQVHPLAA